MGAVVLMYMIVFNGCGLCPGTHFQKRGGYVLIKVHMYSWAVLLLFFF